jgi:hypothetical protein
MDHGQSIQREVAQRRSWQYWSIQNKMLRKIEEKMVVKEDIEALIESIEIASNSKTMEALHKSDEDTKAERLNRYFS